MDIKLRDKEIIERLRIFKEIENIKSNTKAIERLLNISDEFVLILKKNEKLRHKKTPQRILEGFLL